MTDQTWVLSDKEVFCSSCEFLRCCNVIIIVDLHTFCCRGDLQPSCNFARKCELNCKLTQGREKLQSYGCLITVMTWFYVYYCKVCHRAPMVQWSITDLSFGCVVSVYRIWRRFGAVWCLNVESGFRRFTVRNWSCFGEVPRRFFGSLSFGRVSMRWYVRLDTNS